jgi:hypothetical protein
MSSSKRKDEQAKSPSTTKRAGSGARGRQGATVERSAERRGARVATGTASTERNHGRAKPEREGRVRRQGTA